MSSLGLKLSVAAASVFLVLTPVDKAEAGAGSSLTNIIEELLGRGPGAAGRAYNGQHSEPKDQAKIEAENAERAKLFESEAAAEREELERMAQELARQQRIQMGERAEGITGRDHELDLD